MRLAQRLLTYIFSLLIVLICYSEVYAWQTQYIMPGSYYCGVDTGSEIVTNLQTNEPSVAVYCAFCDSPNSNVKYATLHNGIWTFETVDSYESYLSDFDVSLAFHPVSGLPAVTYLDGNGNICYSQKWIGGWNKEVVTNVIGRNSSLVFESSGSPLIIYDDSDNFTVKLAKKVGVNWEFSEIEQSAGGSDLAINPNTGYPAVSYIRVDFLNMTLSIIYAYFDGYTWVKTQVDPSLYADAKTTAIAFSPITGYPAIVYSASIGSENGQLKCARWNGNTWVLDVIDAPDSDIWYSNLGFAFNPVNGHPSVTYSIDQIQNGFPYHTPLIFAQHDGSNWSKQVVFYDEHSNIFANISLCFSNEGFPRILTGPAYITNNGNNRPNLDFLPLLLD